MANSLSDNLQTHSAPSKVSSMPVVVVDARMPDLSESSASTQDTAEHTCMVIRFICLHCGMSLAVPEEQAGKWVRCKECEHRVKVPYQPAEPGQPRMTTRRVQKHRRNRQARREAPATDQTSKSHRPVSEHAIRSTRKPHINRTVVVPAEHDIGKQSEVKPESATLPSAIAIEASPSAATGLIAPTSLVDSTSIAAPAQASPSRKPSVVIQQFLALLLRMRLRGLPATSTSTITGVGLYVDMLVGAILGGILWWLLIWYTGYHWHWLALLPGLLTGLVTALHHRDCLEQRLRPALAVAGAVMMVGLIGVAWGTHASVTARELMDDSRTVRHAIMLNLLADHQLPATLQQQIDREQSYNPQDPGDFFHRVSIPVYTEMEILSNAHREKLSDKQLHTAMKRLLPAFVDNPSSLASGIRRLGPMAGLWGFGGMLLAAGLPWLRLRIRHP